MANLLLEGYTRGLKDDRSDAGPMWRSSLASSTSSEDFSRVEWKRSNSQLLINRLTGHLVLGGVHLDGTALIRVSRSLAWRSRRAYSIGGKRVECRPFGISSHPPLSGGA